MKKLLGVIGDPVSHSLSPFIQNQWLRENGIDAVYAALEVKAGELEQSLRSLETHGAIGLNVTLPHKQDALRLAARASDTARRLGAANTLIPRKEGGWHADNTDAPGFALTLDYGDIDVKDREVFLLGAGGSARAVADTLVQRGARLTICNRTVDRADALALALAPSARILTLDEGLLRLHTAALVVNTLSLGHQADTCNCRKRPAASSTTFPMARPPPPLPPKPNPGWRALDGLGMLVAQAALSFEKWFGAMPDLGSAHTRARKLLEAVQ